MTFSATQEGGSLFIEAWRWKYFSWGLGSGIVTFVILSLFRLPILLVFGLVRGLGQTTPAAIILEMAGALVGRFYFRKKFGDRWLKFAPVLSAGFACGVGVAALVTVAFTIINKMLSPLIF